MAKDTYWFSHDSNARMDEKTLELRASYGWEGYGIYWAIVETLREQDGYVFSMSKIGGLAVSIGKDKEWTEKFVRDCIDEFKLFAEDGKVFYSQSLMTRMASWDEKRENNRNAAFVRWHKENNADAMHMHTERNADAMPIIEENIRKENTEEEECAASPCATPPVFVLLATKKTPVSISQSDLAQWTEAYPGVNVLQELKKAAAWMDANPSKRKTAQGMKRFAVNWLSRAQDRGGTIAAPQMRYGKNLAEN